MSNYTEVLLAHDKLEAENEQLKAQNMAMSRVVEAAIEVNAHYPNGLIELNKALVTYKQTIEG